MIPKTGQSPLSRRAVLGGVAAVTAAATTLGAARPASAASTADAASHKKKAAAPQFLMGINTHMTGSKYIPDAVNVVAQMGTNSVRDQISWNVVEQQPGVYQVPAEIDTYYRDAAAKGLNPLVILVYGNPLYDGGERPTSPEGIAAFTNYARFLANHFHGVVTRYEVWNEWDIPIGGVTGSGDAAAYVNLLSSVYPALKAVDPNITVVGGVASSISPTYNTALLDNGLLQHCDVFSVHTYVYAGLPVEDRIPEVWLQQMLDIQTLLRSYNNGVDFPVYITELSWPTGIKGVVDETGVTYELEAAYVARLYLLARTLPFLKGVWLYEFQDEGWTYNLYGTNYGLVRPDLTPKDGYFSFQSISSLVTHGTYVERQPAIDPNVWALRFTDVDGNDVMALWNQYLDNNYSVVLHDNGTRFEPLQFQQAGGVPVMRQWGRRAWYDATGASLTLNDIDVTLRRAPMLITGPLDDVVVRIVRMHTFPELQR